jgi:hypothetical protein
MIGLVKHLKMNADDPDQIAPGRAETMTKIQMFQTAGFPVVTKRILFLTFGI